MKKLYIEIKYDKGNIAKGYILDLSQGGIAIACSKMINNDKIIEIKTENNVLAPLKGKVISCVNRQKKVYGYRLGIKFISVVMDKKKKLMKFISGVEKREKTRLNLL